MPEFLKTIGEGLQRFGEGYNDPTGERRAAARSYDARTRYNDAAAQSIESENEREDMLARRQAMAVDAMQVNQLLKSGNVDAATMLVNDRLDQLKQLDADPKDTMRLQSMIYNGDIDGAIAATDAVVNAGYSAGLLEPPGGGKGFDPMSPKVQGNQMIVEVAPNQFQAVPIGSLTPDPVEPDFDPESQRKYLQDARKIITGLKSGTRETEQQFGKLEASYNAGNKVGDMALVIQLMKTLDPASVVREGEQQQVQRTAGITDSAWNLYTSLTGERSLSDEQRADILDIGRNFVESQKMSTDVAVFEQLKYAEADKFNVERVLGESAAKRWRQPRFTAQNKRTGEPINFSLYEVLEQAQEWGVRPADAMERLGINLEESMQ